MEHLRFNAQLRGYVQQAEALLAGWQSGDRQAERIFRSKHPKFLDDKIPWLERRMSDAEVRATPIDRDDALLAVARAYDFLDWASLVSWVEAVHVPGSPVARFEAAVDAIVDGDATTLARLLRDDPGLVHARSTRVNCFDPPVHRACCTARCIAPGIH